MISEVDALLADSPMELDYIFNELPLIVKMMEEARESGIQSESQGGIVLTYVTIARHLIDSGLMESIPEDSSDAQAEEEDLPPVGSSPILGSSDESIEPSMAVQTPIPAPKSSYSPDIKDIVKKLVDAGVDMSMLQIIPRKDHKGDIAFKICGPLPQVSFETIARINAMFMTATGRGISLESEVPVNFVFQV
jgi:hypothetical protein